VNLYLLSFVRVLSNCAIYITLTGKGYGMIDWEMFAAHNDLTPEEFQHEILTCAAVLAAMALEKDGANAMKFTCPDKKGQITMLITQAITNSP